MFEYKAPLRDHKFVMQELLNSDKHYQTLGYEDANEEMVDAILSISSFDNLTGIFKQTLLLNKSPETRNSSSSSSML